MEGNVIKLRTIKSCRKKSPKGFTILSPLSKNTQSFSMNIVNTILHFTYIIWLITF